jgi:alpha-tubulin suppressor-like RCC1 family protein
MMLRGDLPIWDPLPAGFTLNNPFRSATLSPRERANSYEYLGPAQTIAAGLEHSIALKVDGTLREWGNLNPFMTPIPEDHVADIIAIASGYDYSLFLGSDGTVVSWQYDRFVPAIPPEELRPVAAIAAGFNHGIALRTDGTLRTWGMGKQRDARFPTHSC